MAKSKDPRRKKREAPLTVEFVCLTTEPNAEAKAFTPRPCESSFPTQDEFDLPANAIAQQGYGRLIRKVVTIYHSATGSTRMVVL